VLSLGAQVVDLARLALSQCKVIAPDDVPYVTQIPRHIQRAHADLRCAQSYLDLGDLRGEVRGHEALALPRTDVVEGPHTDRRHPMGEMVLETEVVLSNLTHGIGRCRTKGCLLINRQIVRRNEPILMPRAYHQHSACQPCSHHGVQDIQLHADIVFQR
jgi:hypothetical protein